MINVLWETYCYVNTARVNLRKLEKNQMRKLALAHLLFFLLLITLITPAYASVKIQAVIDQDVHVAFDFENINSTVYWIIQGEKLINETTIPSKIRENLEQKNLTKVDFFTEPPVFDDSTFSIHVAFYLTGSDVMNFTVNTELMTKTYYVRTDWRNFQINITEEFSLDFAESFGKPIEEWTRQDNYTLNDKTRPAYYYNSTDSLCYFILPAEATNVHAVEDTIIFDIPMPFEDSLLNSPFLILGALIVVIIAFSLYRKVKK